MLANVRDIGNVGVVSDVAAWDLPPNALTDGRNFRVSAGKVSASGGSELVSTEGSAGGEIGHIEQSTDFEGTSAWLVCHDNGIDERIFVLHLRRGARGSSTEPRVHATRRQWTAECEQSSGVDRCSS